ncbi:class I SAM-dependent methyltransferase [Candidatus Phyllobacterium onerii]|uniref:class I SAM-dependent methyltransferase n=1 Tax=Candidatus Phyllobacterium onerii TaxID=3020828 RepID=UPI002FEE5098
MRNSWSQAIPRLQRLPEPNCAIVDRLLRSGGLYLHHAITRRMKRDRKTFGRKSPEHCHWSSTFPRRRAGPSRHDVGNLREHYGKTCRMWADRLRARFDEAIAEVGSPRARLRLLYLTGGALAFKRGPCRSTRHWHPSASGAYPPCRRRSDLYR